MLYGVRYVVYGIWQYGIWYTLGLKGSQAQKYGGIIGHYVQSILSMIAFGSSYHHNSLGTAQLGLSDLVWGSHLHSAALQFLQVRAPNSVYPASTAHSYPKPPKDHEAKKLTADLSEVR